MYIADMLSRAYLTEQHHKEISPYFNYSKKKQFSKISKRLNLQSIFESVRSHSSRLRHALKEM